MERKTLFKLDTPYRDPFTIEAFVFGPVKSDAQASEPETVAIIGSLRGNEVQQTFICASVVKRLNELEARNALPKGLRIMVVPSANSFSMNISSRFWPMDNTDINRMFPGYDKGETTQRIADGLFSAIKDCTYGIQLCSYHLPGDFDPHVRITDTGAISLGESERLAKMFGFPYMVVREPSPFDTTTLNYNWQVWGTHAFSLYSAATDRLDWDSARFTVDCIMRFLESVGNGESDDGEMSDAESCELPPTAALRESDNGEMLDAESSSSGSSTKTIDETSLVAVRTTRGGFLDRAAVIGQRVSKGEVLAKVLSPEDCSVRETLTSPCDGVVFFRHRSVLVDGSTIAFTVIDE